MRVFVGTMLGGDVGRWCEQQVTALTVGHPAALRGIPRGTAHLTHLFCPNLNDLPIDTFVSAIQSAARNVAPFGVRLGGLAVLPPGPRPRLIVVDVLSGGSLLSRLSAMFVAGIRQVCPTLSVDAPRSAHVTLARFRQHLPTRDTRSLAGTVMGLGRSMGTRSVPIDRVQIVRSTLTESGPVYDVLSVVLLGSIEQAT